MVKKLILFVAIICCLPAQSQLSIDSINRAVDSMPSIRKKINKAISFSRGRTLNNTDYEFIKSKLLNIAGSSAKKSDLGYAYYQFGLLYAAQKKYNDAIKYYFEGLKIAEPAKDSLVTAHIYYRLANAYKELKNTSYAKKYYYRCISLSLQLKNDEDLVESYNVLGTIYKNNSQSDSALFYNKKALEIRLKLNDRKGLASTYNNIGLVYKKMKNYDLARNYLERALTLRTELDDKKGVAGASINIGNVLIQEKEYKRALEYIHKGTDLANKIKSGDFFINGLDALGNCYYGLKDYKSAADYRQKYKDAKDSIAAETIDKQVSELAAQYETTKKDSELKLKEEQIKSKIAENTKQKILIVASIIALTMALIAVFFIYRSFKQNKRNAVQLAFKNKLIEEKNKEITDSINYARVIQTSLLAPKDLLDKNLKDYFILYKPKDIVSGDFYWAAENENGCTLACVDCTGHGVPGAFMSLIGKENLDKAIAKTNSPQKVLSELNRNVKKSLNQKGDNATRDGMDAAVVKMEGKTGRVQLTYAGANRPLWIVRKDGNDVEEIKATKHAIGGFTDNEQVFEEHNIELLPGDSFYIFTDGFADQFGGGKQKKITTRIFRELLVKHRDRTPAELKNILEGFFMEWRGNNEQIDDILVIGVRV